LNRLNGLPIQTTKQTLKQRRSYPGSTGHGVGALADYEDQRTSEKSSLLRNYSDETKKQNKIIVE